MTTVGEFASLLTLTWTFGTVISGDSQSCTCPDPASSIALATWSFVFFNDWRDSLSCKYSLKCRKFNRMFNKTGLLESLR